MQKNRTRKVLPKSAYSQKTRILIAVLLAFVPLLTSIVRCAIDGKTIMDVYLPSSPWNDELFYYKLTEGVIHFGVPQGFFGFNESHGMVLSFAAWSPLLLIFWSIWGLLFGWNLLSPIICNIVIMMIAMFLFGYFVRPDWKKAIGVGVLFAAFTPVTRYMLSGMPEVTCFVLLLTFFTIAIYHERQGREGLAAVRIVLLFAIAMLLTWMRPYYILLFLTVFWFMRKYYSLKKAIPVTAVMIVITAIVYYLINHYLSAPYLTDLFYTDWLTAYIDRGLLGGFKYTLWKLYTSGMSVLGMIREASTGDGLASGALYVAFYLCGLFWLVAILLQIREYLQHKKAEKVAFPIVLQIQMFLLILGFGTADLLMYRLTEGSKHTAGFILVTVCLIPLVWHKKDTIVTGIALIFLLYFFGIRARTEYDYAIPYVEQSREDDLNNLAQQLTQNMQLVDGGPSYENTIIWALWDQVDGETVTTDFGAFYMMPKGFGINLCDGGFMTAEQEELQSRYIAAPVGGEIEQKCIEDGGQKVGECETIVVYDMH